MNEVDFMDIDVREVGDKIRITGSHIIDNRRKNFLILLTKDQAITIQGELNRLFPLNLIDKLFKEW